MVRKLPRIKTLEEHRLSDGGLAMITVYKRSYSFCRTHADRHTPPDDFHGLTKSQAYQKLEEYLQKDVLELD